MFIGATDDFRAIVALYDGNGNYIDNLVYNDYPKMFFNGIEKALSVDSMYSLLWGVLDANGTSYDDPSFESNTIFTLVGGAEESGTIYPLTCVFNIYQTEFGQDVVLQKNIPVNYTQETLKLYKDYPAYRFKKIKAGNYLPPETNGDGASCDYTNAFVEQPIYYVSSYKKNDAGETIEASKLFILKNYWTFTYDVVNCSLNSERLTSEQAILSVTNVVNTSAFFSYIRDIEVEGTAAYLSGYTETDENKPSNPSNGYWNAGFIAKIDNSGQIIWKKQISLSKYDDSFNDAYLDDKYLYCAGRYATFVKTKSRNYFGYAWLSKIDKNTGNVISNSFFGENSYCSTFNSILGAEGKLYLAGFTKYFNLYKDEAQAWFIKANTTSFKQQAMKNIKTKEIGIENIDNMDKEVF